MSYFGQSQTSTYYGMNMGTINSIIGQHMACSKMVCSEFHDARSLLRFFTRGTFSSVGMRKKYEQSHECHCINCCSCGIMSLLHFLLLWVIESCRTAVITYQIKAYPGNFNCVTNSANSCRFIALKAGTVIQNNYFKTVHIMQHQNNPASVLPFYYITGFTLD